MGNGCFDSASGFSYPQSQLCVTVCALLPAKWVKRGSILGAVGTHKHTSFPSSHHIRLLADLMTCWWICVLLQLYGEADFSWLENQFSIFSSIIQCCTISQLWTTSKTMNFSLFSRNKSSEKKIIANSLVSRFIVCQEILLVFALSSRYRSTKLVRTLFAQNFQNSAISLRANGTTGCKIAPYMHMHLCMVCSCACVLEGPRVGIVFPGYLATQVGRLICILPFVWGAFKFFYISQGFHESFLLIQDYN